MKKSRETTAYSRWTMACLCLLLASVGLYLYFLNMSVVQVVMRTEHMQAQRTLQAEIALLEADYIAAQHRIAAKIATLDGYTLNTQKIFVSRKQESLVLRGE